MENKLRTFLDKEGVSLYDLCSITKYSYPTISRYVQGTLDNEQTCDHIDYILADHFQVTKEEFLKIK